VTLYVSPADLAGNNYTIDATTESPGADWQRLRLPLQRLANRLHLQRATMIAVAEAIGIPTEAD